MPELTLPRRVDFVRHGLSKYNAGRLLMADDPEYRHFKRSYDEDPASKETHYLAEMLNKRYAPLTGDAKTPLADGAHKTAVLTGQRLRESGRSVPNVIFYSPHERAKGTLLGLDEGWPELAQAERFEDRRVREQEHGLRLLYNDRRLFFALNPEQRRLHEYEGAYLYRYPQGESIPDVQTRAESFVSMLLQEFSDQNVFVITHHVFILAVRMILERFNEKEFLRLDENDRPANCSITTYRGVLGCGRHGESRLQLESYNQQFC